METVKVLITQGADRNYLGERYGSALYQAAFNDHHNVVKLLIEAKADVNICNNPMMAPLVATCRGRDIDMKTARLLLDNGADIADTLIAFGLDVNSHDFLLRTPLHFACSAESDKRHKDIADLLSAKVDELVSGSFLAALRKKLAEKRLAMVRLLVEKKADVNARRAGGISVLHDALERDDRDVVDFLIANGASLDQEGEASNLEDGRRGVVNDDDQQGHVKSGRT